MTRGIALSAAVLGATFSLAPFAGAQEAAAERAQQRAVQAGQAAERQAGEAAEDMKMNADQRFVREAAADNQFEIQLSQFVEQQAQEPQVKELAQKLAQDHQRAQQELQEVAQGINLQLPTQLERWQQEKLQAMQQKHGKHLEMHYVFGQVGGHTTDLLKYQYEAEHGENAQVKQYAQRTIPILEKHLDMAQQAAQQWVPQARTAGEHQRGDANRPERANDAGTGIQDGTRGPNNQGGNR
jgi:putative membrane protein